MIDLRIGDCLVVLKSLPDCSVDAVVTDPPYGLGFMGKKWDYDVPGIEVWAECLRVLKPGGHLLAFAGTRTQHRMAVRIEDAGFEIRDMIAWIYGSGFPKSRNLDGEWAGWGTALKPAMEPITFARKPLAGTVIDNVMEYGTGAINIDGCRVPITSADDGRQFDYNHNGCNRSTVPAGGKLGMHDGGWKVRKGDVLVPEGRWPANIIHDGSDEVVALFPETSSGSMSSGTQRAAQDAPGSVCYGVFGGNATSKNIEANSGSASRFFYCAKSTRADRNDGCDGLDEKSLNWSSGSQNPGKFQSENTKRSAENHHPTVKPTELMRYLCKLVTPQNGVVLDPFMGSGSTGRGAVLEGFGFIGIEREADYFSIAERRVFAAKQRYDDEHRQLGLEFVG